MKRVALVKASSYNNKLKDKMLQAINIIDGLQPLVGHGKRVLIKPNFLFARPAETAVTTNPLFIIALVEILKDYGCKVSVGDSPALGSTKKVVDKLALTEPFQKLGVEVVEFRIPKRVKSQNNINIQFQRLNLAKELEEFDIIVNLPKLKTHGQMGITLATKNLYGCIVGNEKTHWHFEVGKDTSAFAQLLVEVALSVNAHIHILDGIIGMDGNGPSSGRIRNTGVILASKNCIALDRVVVELIGRRPQEFPLFSAAKKLGLPGTDINEIDIKGATISQCLIEDFQIPALTTTEFIENTYLRNIIKGLLNQRVNVDNNLCKLCGKCYKQCPARVIEINNKIKIDYKKCIKCCCCQEICPHGAISISEPLILKIFKKIKI